ncbi:MAG: PD40 domain-containing protein [Rudaea sp.]|nr:PD40 domain-containing protein [Rudaea sp.]
MNANLQMLRRSPSAEQLKLQNLRLRVGEHAVDVGALRVIGDGGTARVTGKAVAVLLELVRHAGNTVSREDLLETVWKDRVTTPDVLTQAIKELRRAFADGDKASAYIETIPKVGYRLLAEVSVIEADEIPIGQLGPMSLRAENESWVDTQPDEDADVRLASIPAQAVPAMAPPAKRRAWALPLAALLVIAAVAGLYFVRAGLSSLPPWRISNLRALTSDPGAELLPHVSPDGTRVAYGKLIEETGLDRLFIRAVEPSQLVALAPNTEHSHDIRPVWSPDGSRIAYERITHDKCTLYIVAGLGGSEREVGDCEDFGTAYFDFAPDGQELVVGLRGGGTQSDLRITRLNITSGAKQALNYESARGDQDLEPRYSPDGRWIAFRRGLSPYSDLYLMRADGGGVRRLTRLSGNLRGFTWTADSLGLVFSSNLHGKFELFAVGIEGTGVLQRLGVAPAVFPDAARGGKIVVYQIQRTTSALAEVDLSVPGGAVRKLAAASSGSDSAPAVSADGGRVAFISDRSGSSQLWLYDRATGSAEALTEYRDAVLSNPVWRADAAAVLINVRQEPSTSRLVEIDLASRRARDISAKDENVLFGDYGTKPGSFLLAIGATSNGARLVQRENAGGPGQKDEEVAIGVQHAETDVAHGQIYYTRIGTAGLFRRSLPAGAEQAVSDKINALMLDGWHVVDGKIWYLVPIDVRMAIVHEFDPLTKADRVIAELPITVGAVSFSADAAHRRLYLDQVSNQDTDVGAFDLERDAAH